MISLFIPILGPVAIIVSSGAMRDDPLDGNAKAGLVTGWIGTVFLFLICIYFIVVFALAGILINRLN